MLILATASQHRSGTLGQQREIRALAAEKAAENQKDSAEDREQLAIDAVQRYGEVVRETPTQDQPRPRQATGHAPQRTQAFFRRLRDRLQADGATTPSRSVAWQRQISPRATSPIRNR